MLIHRASQTYTCADLSLFFIKISSYAHPILMFFSGNLNLEVVIFMSFIKGGGKARGLNQSVYFMTEPSHVKMSPSRCGMT
jgi:hypothetical protein